MAEAKRPRLSLIVPFKSGRAHVVGCIASILRQSQKPAEIIFVDDDAIEEMTLALTSEVTYHRAALLGVKIRFVEGPGQGPALARNAGVAAATGDWLLFHDIDDSMAPDFVERILDSADAATEMIYPRWLVRYDPAKETRIDKLLACCSYAVRVAPWKRYHGENVGGGYVAHLFEVPPWDQLNLPVQNEVPISFAMRRDVFESIGGFAKEYGYEDWEFLVRVKDRGLAAKRVNTVLLVQDSPGSYSKTMRVDRETDSIRAKAWTLGQTQNRDCNVLVFSSEPTRGIRLHHQLWLQHRGIPYEALLIDDTPKGLQTLQARLAGVSPRRIICYSFAGSPQAWAWMAREFPDTEIVLLSLSDLPFLLTEGNITIDRLEPAIQAANTHPNVALGVSNERASREWSVAFGFPITFVPPVYGLPVLKESSLVRGNDRAQDITGGADLLVSIFGAERPLKNLGTQIEALALWEHRDRVTCCFTTHHDAKGVALARLCGLRHKDFGHVNWTAFQDICSAMHFGLQVSFTETLNYTALDHLRLGVPIVISSAMPYAEGWPYTVTDFHGVGPIISAMDALVANAGEAGDLALATAKAVQTRMDEQASKFFVDEEGPS